MSHFTCFCVGNVDEVMEKFNEQDENYIVPLCYKQSRIEEVLDIHRKKLHPETIKNYEESVPENERGEISFYGWYHDSVPSYTSEELKANLDSKTRTFFVENGEIMESFYFANPDAKYDYYCVIGNDSYARFQYLGFPMKDGSKANSGRIGDLDIDAMIAEEENEYRKEYRRVFEGVGELHHTPWKDYVERIKKGELTRDEARALYFMQPDVKRFDKWCNDNDIYFGDADKYLCTEDEYAAQATVPVFSANILGEWYEKADMGWWGMTSDDKDPKEWKKLIEGALRKAQEEHPDEMFHVLDCHI